MEDNRKFDIPEDFRGFSSAGLEERRRLAEGFIRSFVENLAPSKADDDSDETWTRVVRARFIEICPKNCYALPSNAGSREGEYLADYTWSEENEGGRVLLAGESEWGSGRFGKTYWAPVEIDFEKLLPIKARLKVLIFSSDSGHSSQQDPGTNFSFEYACSRIRDSLESYWDHLAGETYIFIDLPKTRVPGGDGKYWSLIWVAKEFGRNEVELLLGPEGKLARPAEHSAV